MKPFAANCEYYTYETEAHGFFTRGDTKLDHTREAIDEILSNIVEFVKKVGTPIDGV